MERLIDILKRGLVSDLDAGWLYLPSAVEWGPDTPALILDANRLPEAEITGDGVPTVAVEHDLMEALDSQTIEDVVRSAARIESPPSDDLLVEAFLYYYDNDAFLPSRGFIPPSPEEVIGRVDCDFYNSLGPESVIEKCKIEICQRGHVQFSVLCRVHHFEMTRKKKCPFAHE